jgi:hypothetical protein
MPIYYVCKCVIVHVLSEAFLLLLSMNGMGLLSATGISKQHTQVQASSLSLRCKWKWIQQHLLIAINCQFQKAKHVSNINKRRLRLKLCSWA